MVKPSDSVRAVDTVFCLLRVILDVIFDRRYVKLLSTEDPLRRMSSARRYPVSRMSRSFLMYRIQAEMMLRLRMHCVQISTRHQSKERSFDDLRGPR